MMIDDAMARLLALQVGHLRVLSAAMGRPVTAGEALRAVAGGWPDQAGVAAAARGRGRLCQRGNKPFHPITTQQVVGVTERVRGMDATR